MSRFTNEHVAELATKLQFQHEGDVEAFSDYILQKLHQRTDEVREEILTRYIFLVLESGQDPFNDAIIKKNVDFLKDLNEKISIIERVWTYIDKYGTIDINNLPEHVVEEDEIDNLPETGEE